MSRRLRGAHADPGDTKQSSSTSSISSVRFDRPTRSSLRHEESMTNSLTPHSSSDDIERRKPTETQARLTRLQRKSTGGPDGANDKPEDEEINEEDLQDVEVTRCVCGKDEYPGPPVPLVDNARSVSSRDSQQRTIPGTAAESSSEDGGFFIQCDKCHVWQHGGCVGIMKESLAPTSYWCEQCRADLHTVSNRLRG